MILTTALSVVGGIGAITSEANAWPDIVSVPLCKKDLHQAFSVDLSTGTTNGVKNPLGMGDPKWYLTYVPNWPGLFTAYSIERYPWYWIYNPPTGANWIQRSKPYGPQFLANFYSDIGTYIYKVRFNITNPAAYTTLSVVGRFATDDSGLIRLNGYFITFSAGFIAWKSFSATSPFVAGINELEVVVTNVGGPMGSPSGAIVDAKVQANCGVHH